MKAAASTEHDATLRLAALAARPVRLSASARRRLARDGRYDLHRLIELVEHGCPPELALRILAPLEEEKAA